MDQVLLTFYNVVAPVALITLLSFWVARRFEFNTRTLSRVVIYLATPALVFDSISKTSLQLAEVGELVIYTAIVIIAMTAIGWGLGRALRLEQQAASAFALSTMLVNVGNFGLPLSAFAFGPEGLSRAVVIFLTNNLLANTLGIFIASRGSGSVKKALLNVIQVPIPYAIVAALIVNAGNLPVPPPLERGASLLGQAMVPMMLVILGVQLARTRLGSRLQVVSLASGVRIIGAPLVALALVWLVQMPGLNADVFIIQMSMPTAVLSIVFAEEFGSDVGLASGAVLISTLGSFVTLSVLLSLLMA